jgi:hypothetical protein
VRRINNKEASINRLKVKKDPSLVRDALSLQSIHREFQQLTERDVPIIRSLVESFQYLSGRLDTEVTVALGSVAPLLALEFSRQTGLVPWNLQEYGGSIPIAETEHS